MAQVRFRRQNVSLFSLSSHHKRADSVRILPAILACLAVLLSPTLAQAAAPLTLLAQTSLYEDPDGRFSLNVPDSFSEAQPITYDMVGDNPLNQLLDSSGVLITERETPNGVSVLFLLLEQEITNWDDFAAFIASFQIAAGGEVLPLVDFRREAGDALVASGSAATRDRQLQVRIEADDGIVSVLSTSVERARYRELRTALADAFDSFTWDPVNVELSLLLGPPSSEEASSTDEASPPDEEPVDEEPVEEAPAQKESADMEGAPAEEPGAQDVLKSDGQTDSQQEDGPAQENERYSDEAGVFSVIIPTGLEASEISDADNVVYGSSFYGPDNDETPTLGVVFTPAVYAANDSDGVPQFDEVDDEVWNQFVDVFLLDSAKGMEVYTEQRSDYYHTAFFLLDETDPGSEPPMEMWVWLEESDGMGAALVVFGEKDDPANAEIFHSALTSLSWSPQAAASETASLAGVTDPAQAPVAFDDPFDLIAVSTPPDYPFQAAYFEEGAVQYTFGRSPIDGVIQIGISVPGEGTFNADAWSLVVDEAEKSVMQTLSDAGLGGDPRLVEKSIGQPEIRADNTALVVARTDLYWMAIVLAETDGVLATEVFVVPDSWWQDHEAHMIEAVNVGIDFDPGAIRDIIDEREASDVFVLETGTTDSLPTRGEEIDWRYTFEPDEAFTVAVDFATPALDSTFKVIVFPDNLPDHPLAQFAQWLGADEQVSYGAMTSQEDTGTRAAFTYTPDFPMNAGEYTAYLYYDNELLAANGFTVKDRLPESADIASFAPAYGEAFAGEPLLVTTAVHPGDLVTVRGSVDLPAGTQLRLFWYDPDGWLDTGEVGTIRLDSSYHIPYDWVYFEPEIDWQPGTYTYLLTADGEPFANGQLQVVEETDEIALTDDAGAYIAALPLPTDLAVTTEVEGFDLAILPSETYPSTDVVSVVDAWLRSQRWQAALPPIGAPVAWDYRRWVKDSYQLVLQPGTDGAEDEIWIRYSPRVDATFGPVPSGDQLDLDTIDTMTEVAQLGIDGFSATQAAMSPDGNWLAVTTTDGTLYIFDALRLLDTVWWQPDGFYANPVFSPDSRDLAVTLQRQTGSEVQLFSNFDVMWLPTTRFNGHTDTITAIDYQSDGWLATGGLDGAFRQWDPVGEYLPAMVDSDAPISGLAAAPEDAPGLLVAREGGSVEYLLDDGETAWSDVATTTEFPRITAWSAFDENGVGDYAVFGEGQVEWFTFNTEETDTVGSAPVDDESFASTGAAFSPNGALFGISGDTAHFYDRASGEWLGEWEVSIDGNRVPITSLGMSPNGQYAIVVSEDGVTRLWAATEQ